MAAGDTLMFFDALDHRPAYRPHGSGSPIATLRGEGRAVLSFPQDTNARYAFFESVMPRAYAGGGILLQLCVAAQNTTGSGMYWYAAFERHHPGRSLWTDAWGPIRGGWAGVPSVAGVPAYPQIGFENNASIDGVQVGEHFRLLIQMPGADIPGHLELYSVEVIEHPTAK